MNASAAERPNIKPFTRAVTVPPGWPWDQTRAASLEALHTSPVSGDAVTTLVRRLRPWRFNEPGEFAAVYLRGGAELGGQSFDIQIQGQTLRVEVPSRAKREALMKERLWQIGSAVAIAIIVFAIITIALQRREELEDRLSQAELRVDHQAKEAQAVARAKSDARMLAAMDLKDQGVDAALRDLEYVAFTRETTSRVDAFYWRKGFWAVEAHGDAPPVAAADGLLQRSVKPVRSGVWLWASKSGNARP